jgi:hypothetical protein
MDMKHYRDNVARIIEDGIIRAFGGVGGEAGGG